MPNSRIKNNKLTRLFAVGSILVVFVIAPLVSSLAQRRSKERAPRVTGISSRKTATGEVISLAADSALNGTQTWQDPNGSFHLVLPGSGESPIKGSPRGVKVRRVGNSLEIEIQAKRGSNVTVEPRFNRLDLVVNGGLDSQEVANNSNVNPARQSSARREVQAAIPSRLVRTAREPVNTKEVATRKQLSQRLMTLPSLPIEKTNATSPASGQPEVQPSAANAPAQSAPVDSSSPATAADAASQEAASSDTQEQSSFLSFFVTSGWWVTLILILVLIGLLVWRRRNKAGWEEVEDEERSDKVAAPVVPAGVNAIMGDRRQTPRRNEGRAGGRRGDDSKSVKPGSPELVEPNEQMVVRRSTAATLAPAALFGAYRVDQEVGKLVLGLAHRMDVLASRGADDRRAMEASLLKTLRSSDVDEDGRRRARQALEEYGFVARQSAAVLLAQDSCERVAAARMLGEIGLATSLQFLLEALYDSDTIVRTQAVESIGNLKLPSAIGALLDIAHRYPDVSSSVLSHALNACSIESLDIFNSTSEQSALLLSGGIERFTSEIKQLEPSATFQSLPDSSDDEVLVDTLAMLQSIDAGARALAAQTLAIYRVPRSVSALKLLAANDPEPAVRAVAVASLGAIDHESVFSAVLVALADEARDVRAAAARAVSRLSFDRADAYARVIEMSDAQELSDVACACIKTGMAAQALDRLNSDDRRQAYEAFSLLSLLAKADQYQPILDVIEKHADVNTCTVAIQLLGLSGRPDIASQLKQLAIRDGMPEELRKELMDVVYKIDQMQPA